MLTLVVAAKFWSLVAFWSPQSRILSGDFFSLFYPARAFAAQEIWSGRLPFWNPFSACGSPFIADITNAFFYPVQSAACPATGRLGYIWLEYVLLFHFVLAGSFTYALARRLGQTGWGALFSALTFMLSGFLTAHSRHLDILSTAVWLPAIFWGISKTLEKGSIPVAMATGLFWGVSSIGRTSSNFLLCQSGLPGLLYLPGVGEAGCIDPAQPGSKRNAPGPDGNHCLGVFRPAVAPDLGIGPNEHPPPGAPCLPD